MEANSCPGCQALLQRVAELEAQVERLTRLLEEQRRAGKRQAAPFGKGPPKPDPKRPGRKAGEPHGSHGHRRPPPPEQIDEVLEATRPDACPHCGGTVTQTATATQFQTEIPRQPLRRQFTIHVGCCDRCRRRLQGRHPLQTSDATGAAASQLGAVIGRDWEGTLIHDGFASSDRFTAAIPQPCLFHGLRRARDLLEGATRGAVRFPRQVIGLFTAAIHLRNEHVAGRVDPPVWEGARDAFEDRLSALLRWPRAAAAALAAHLWNHFAWWFSFLSDAAVPPTNALGEQAVRPAVVNRKVWGGNRTAAGAPAQGVLTSVLQTCQRQARSAVDFVSQTLRAFGNRLLPRPILLPTR
jgi:transposase